MLKRATFILLSTALIIYAPRHAQADGETIENLGRKEWQVSYKLNESWSTNVPIKNRPAAAIRLHITKTGNDTYTGDIWVFVANTGGTDYQFLGKATGFDLYTERSGGNSKSGANDRTRVAFTSRQAVQLVDENGANVRVIHVNGIWQPGRHTDRASQRIQLKINHGPHRALPASGKSPAPPGKAAPTDDGCENDPDTDVLEEGSPPGSDPLPPPDPPT